MAYAARSTNPSHPHRKPAASQAVGPRKPSPSSLQVLVDIEKTPAYRYGQLSRAACEAELMVRQIPFTRESARGVLAPIRLAGPLHGVLFRGDGTEQEWTKSLHEIVDCRLVLALDDAAEILKEHGIIEVRHYSMYRLPETSWPKGKAAPHHMGGVAIDAGRFLKRNGKVLDVDKHFHGKIGAKTCGAGAGPRPATADALELRRMLCKLVARHIFNLVLTPNYNAPHKNHFHLEVTPGRKWFIVN